MRVIALPFEKNKLLRNISNMSVFQLNWETSDYINWLSRSSAREFGESGRAEIFDLIRVNVGYADGTAAMIVFPVPRLCREHAKLAKIAYMQ